MEFRLTDPRRMNRNTLKGFFTLCIGPFSIEGFSFHRQGKKSWIGFPARPYQDSQTGETKYAQFIRIQDENRFRNFQKWCTAKARELFKSVQPEREPDPAPAYTEGDDIPF
jgi:hypothetical protein